MTLRLADLEAPLDDVEFPNGTIHQPVPFGPSEYKLWREARQSTDEAFRDEAVVKILRACYPTATEEDLSLCTPRMVAAMIAHAARKIEQVRDALKNVAGAPKEPPAEEPLETTAPLSPKTNGPTSASSSRKRSAKTSGTSTTANLTASPT